MKQTGGIKLPGFKFDKSGKLVKDEKRLDLCTRLKKRHSKKIRYRPVPKQGVML